MKYNKSILSVGLAMILVIFSCKKIDLKPNLNPVDVPINVSYSRNFPFPLKDIKIKMENLWNINHVLVDPETLS